MKTTNKIKIAIAGIGGIGGYIGGKLANHYANNESFEIIFIARGEMAKVIKEKGLWLDSYDTSYKCIPTLTSDNPIEIGTIDILIICTKSFSVKDILVKYNDCLTNNTTIITTQNTVNGEEIITPLIPSGANLMQGSIYIASNIIKLGKIQHLSGPAKFIFGTKNEIKTKGYEIEKILKNAGIDATYTNSITSVLWKKFMFVSPVAIVTALFRITFSEILESTKSEYLLINLTSELMQLARAKNVTFDDNTIINNINLLASFKGKVKSSFQLDLEKGNPSEINSLVNYVIEEGKSQGISTPYFEKSLVQLNEEYKLN